MAKHDELNDGEEETVHGPKGALGWHLGGRDISPLLLGIPQTVISWLTGTLHDCGRKEGWEGRKKGKKKRGRESKPAILNLSSL